MQLCVLSAYGWSGASDREMLRDRTNALVYAVRAEMAARKRMPIFAGMDLNGDTRDFEQNFTALDSGELWGAGEVAHWDLDGEGVALPTCKAHGSRRDTRRDYIFCNAVESSSNPLDYQRPRWCIS